MNKKKLGLIIAAVVLALVIAVVVFVVFFKEETYRVLKVFNVQGEATVTRKDIGEIDPYNNMVLESGDDISLVTGEMSLQADEDKFIYLEEGTELILEAAGDSENSKTTIDLKKGAITNNIKNKLSDGSSYEVNTPNSTMSVRGTIFRVEVYEENGIKYTKISVFEGVVASRLVYKDGTISDEEVLITKDKEVLIFEDDKTTDYVYGPKDIEEAEVPDKVTDMLETEKESGRDVTVPGEGSTEGTGDENVTYCTVTFMYGGAVFGTQTVQKGSTANEPSLVPMDGGSWDWDFSKPVEEDITVKWQ